MEWTLDQLRQFVAAVDAGSISAAARRQGKAQSAVSSAIALLEVDLGVALFDRSGRNIKLTPVGEVMLLEAREFLRQAQGLNQRAQSFAGGEAARLTLAVDEALPYPAVARLLRELALRFPALELSLLNGSAAEVADFVLRRRADLAFQFDRGEVASSLSQKHVGSVQQGLFAARGHALSLLASVSRTELAQHRQLVTQIDDFADLLLSPAVWRSNSVYVIAAMVVDMLGWAILPINIAEYENLQELPCSDLVLPRLSVRMLALHGQTPPAAAQWMEQRMRALLQEA
ncbi:LysR family transcriptional regulator [Herbaspirillum lusitanum]|uniref:LysR family transcriptional regulator n=1 Tax=Herbaspirillum lusitanum TaxID=213312 RepID=A0ABW9A5Z6_9BURK